MRELTSHRGSEPPEQVAPNRGHSLTIKWRWCNHSKLTRTNYQTLLDIRLKNQRLPPLELPSPAALHHVAPEPPAPKGERPSQQEALQHRSSVRHRLRTPPRRGIIDKNHSRLDPRQTSTYTHRMGKRYVVGRSYHTAQPTRHPSSSSTACMGTSHPPISNGKNHGGNQHQLPQW